MTVLLMTVICLSIIEIAIVCNDKPVRRNLVWREKIHEQVVNLVQ
jgi:hypothetical protein